MYKRIFELFHSTKKGDYPLEKEIGLAQGSIKNWRNEKSKPSTDAIIKIANFFNVSIDYLLENNTTAHDFYNPTSEELIYYPVIASIQAGYGKNVEEEYTGDKAGIPRYMIHGDPDDYFVLRVYGSSMAPRYLEGDCVLMQRTAQVDSGQTAAVCIGDEEATLKRVLYDEKRTFITLEPLNENYSPRTFRGEEMNQIRIIGAVKQLIREVY